VRSPRDVDEAGGGHDGGDAGSSASGRPSTMTLPPAHRGRRTTRPPQALGARVGVAAAVAARPPHSSPTRQQSGVEAAPLRPLGTPDERHRPDRRPCLSLWHAPRTPGAIRVSAGNGPVRPIRVRPCRSNDRSCRIGDHGLGHRRGRRSSGHTVVLRSRSQSAADAMVAGLEKSLNRQVEKGKRTESERDQVSRG